MNLRPENGLLGCLKKKKEGRERVSREIGREKRKGKEEGRKKKIILLTVQAQEALGKALRLDAGSLFRASFQFLMPCSYVLCIFLQIKFLIISLIFRQKFGI